MNASQSLLGPSNSSSDSIGDQPQDTSVSGSDSEAPFELNGLISEKLIHESAKAMKVSDMSIPVAMAPYLHSFCHVCYF